MGAPGYVPNDIELQLAQQQGLIPAPPPPGPTLRAAFAPQVQLGDVADAIVAAPPPAAVGPADPTMAAGLPPLGVPVAPAPETLPPPAPAPVLPLAPPAGAPSPAPVHHPRTPGAPPAPGATAPPGPEGTDQFLDRVAAGPKPPALPPPPANMNEFQRVVWEAGLEKHRLAQEGVDVARDTAAADQAAADAKAEGARTASIDAQARQLDADEAKAAALKDRQRLEGEVGGFQFHDFWDNKGVGRQLLGGLGILLSGVNFSANHVNLANQTIQAALVRDAEQQKEQLFSKQHLLDLATQGYEHAESRAAELFHQTTALKLQAVAAEAERLTQNSKNAQAINTAQQLAATYRQEAAGQWAKAEEAKLDQRLKQSQINHNNAAAAAARAAGGAGGKAQTKADQVADAKVSKAIKEDKELQKLIAAKSEVEQARSLLVPDASGHVSGVNFQQAIDMTVRAATGLGARQQSITIFQSGLGGLWDKIQRNISKGVSGEYTPHDVQVLNRALEKQQAFVDEKHGGKRAALTEEFERSPLTKGRKDIYEGRLDTIFGKPAAAPAPGAGAALPPGAVPGNLNGKRGYALGGKFYAL